VELPTPTKVLIAITIDYRPYILGFIAVLALVIAGLFFWSRSEEGGVAFDRIKFRMPVLGETLLKFQVAQFCRTLATLLTGGTPLVAALTTATESIGSRLVRGSVVRATQMVREGESLHGALTATTVMPEMALDMIEVGESSGAMAPMLNSVAEFYEEEVSLRLGSLVSLIEPLILVFMGMVVAGILISLYLPIFSFSIAGTGH
jgi:type IV pilus assembly protein PilC